MLSFWGEFREYSIVGRFLPVVASLHIPFLELVSLSVELNCKRSPSLLSPLLCIVYMTSMQSHSRIDEDVTVGRCRINRLIIADYLVLLASSELGLQHELDRFSAVYDQVGMQISSKKTKVLCLSRNIGQFMLQVRRHDLLETEKFEYLLRWYS